MRSLCRKQHKTLSSGRICSKAVPGLLKRQSAEICTYGKHTNFSRVRLHYEKGTTDRWFSQLVVPGSSLGGARPKANVVDQNGALWIAKFPSRHDQYDVGAWEKTVHDLAKQCQIQVPESQLIKYNDIGSIFLVKRFDRGRDLLGQRTRIHFASAMTMLGLRDGRTTGTGFLDLAEIVSQITDEPDHQLEQLFRRMIFDIAVSNEDDHLRNHGFLLHGDRWILSPAYDINPVPDADSLSMNIDLDDGYRSFEKALSTAAFYHLSMTWKKTPASKPSGLRRGMNSPEQEHYPVPFG